MSRRSYSRLKEEDEVGKKVRMSQGFAVKKDPSDALSTVEVSGMTRGFNHPLHVSQEEANRQPH